MEVLREKRRVRRAMNPDMERAQKRRWAAANRLKTRKYNRIYAEKHPSANAVRRRRYYAERPDHCRSEWVKHARLRRARERMALVGTSIARIAHALS